MRLFAAAALSLMALSSAAMASPERSDNQCFPSNDWTAWTAPGDGDTLLLRVRSHDVYRVGLVPGSHVRKTADRFLVNRLHGTTMICSPLDLNLTLSDQHGFRQPVIARSLHRLTDAEIAALPTHDRP